MPLTPLYSDCLAAVDKHTDRRQLASGCKMEEMLAVSQRTIPNYGIRDFSKIKIPRL
jgi:hypothetical protein